ncbi:HAD family hydrolase [Dermatobacter hominis]|uniref:HAD family hydrolase n=1 Tax=Dermatobacter hominis TaxID=2884263 RepID=UPI001D1258E4|nr:HAD family phosphatase [Dermatobacter hominis]UDY36012.1 HAD family phosphatase [Dermatobacter hominis]
MSARGDRVVVWDLGNVVIPWERRGALARFIDDEDEVERLAAEVFDLETNVHLDRGHAVEEVRAIVEERHPGHGWVVERYVEHFRHSLGPQDGEVAALIDELVDRGVRCVGLSNWSAVSFTGIADDFSAVGRLEGVVISGEERVCKPEPEIFRRCEARFGFRPEQALFFDDSPANVAGARAVGWDAELFTGAAAARLALVSRGLLPGS